VSQSDPYWSRSAPRPEFAERLDPVIWGDGAGPLTPAQRERYASDGYFVQRGLLAEEEVERLVVEIGRLATGATVSPSAAEAGVDDDEVVREPDSALVRSIFAIDRRSELLARLVNDPRLVSAARQILGGDVYVHQSRINFKPPFAGRSFPWHSDFETWHIEDGMPRMRAMSASILLTLNTEHNGPLLVVPGSHRRYVRCVGATPADHFRQSLRNQTYGIPDQALLTELVRQGGIASVTGPPGTVVFFDCNLMHGSASNITPLARHNIFTVYNSSLNPLAQPFGGTPPRPEFLAARARG